MKNFKKIQKKTQVAGELFKLLMKIATQVQVKKIDKNPKKPLKQQVQVKIMLDFVRNAGKQQVAGENSARFRKKRRWNTP